LSDSVFDADQPCVQTGTGTRFLGCNRVDIRFDGGRSEILRVLAVLGDLFLGFEQLLKLAR
jgi:hypothetical protein